MITNDAVIFGLLCGVLGFVFWTSGLGGFWRVFYGYVPALLLCYFMPSLFNSFGLIDVSGSGIYGVVSRYLLPASLIFLTLSVDFKAIGSLGSKAIIMFLAGSFGVVAGGPLALLLVSWVYPLWVLPVGGTPLWQGLSTIAGSWIGGGANQTAMREIFGVNADLFATMVAVDVLISNLWLALLLFCASHSQRIDRWFGADLGVIEGVKARLLVKHSVCVNPSLSQMMVMLGVVMGLVGLAHFLADVLAPFVSLNYPFLKKFSLGSTFFWVIVLSTTFGLLLSFSRSAQQMEGLGASKLGNIFLYLLIATIGMQMDVRSIFSHIHFFVIGFVWIIFHALVLVLVGKLIKSPFFFFAVGSQANIGGAVSAPIVASAFDPSLAPVGVLLAILGYGLGTYGAYVCALLMRVVVP